MAATFSWSEDNGTAAGSPAKGTRTNSRSENNWKAVDDSTTAYSASPIAAGANSYHKYQFGVFSGTFNLIQNAKWSPHTAGVLAANCTLVGKVTSTYATPSAAALGGSPTDFSAITAVGSGASVNFSTTGPENASPTATLAAAGYTQYLVTQLQVGAAASPGDIAAITGTLQYDES